MARIRDWLHPRQDAGRFDAVLAAELEAKSRAGLAATALADTARKRGRDAANVQAEIRQTIRRHSELSSPLGGTTGGIRELVSDMLDSLDASDDRREGRPK